MPGWVDNLNGPVGIMVGWGKGVIRSWLCDDSVHAEVVPVDFSANALILVVRKVAKLVVKFVKLLSTSLVPFLAC
jgi:alcohol-forming fatty acyl-CoA reductase